VDFAKGETVYVQARDTFGPNPEDNSAEQAIRFIRTRMKANNPLQVRWAMLFLGKVKAAEGIPVLLEYLDYRYTTHGIVEESYAALKALRQIGKPAAEAARKELAKEQSDLRTELLCRVVLSVEGKEKGLETLAAERHRLPDAKSLERLDKALQALRKEKP